MPAPPSCGRGCSISSPARASTASTRYGLEDGCLFATGCFDLCACPVLDSPLKGTFVLTRLTPDPLFEHYQVSDVNWIAQEPGGPVAITGSGSYRVGGEFAVQHQ